VAATAVGAQQTFSWVKDFLPQLATGAMTFLPGSGFITVATVIGTGVKTALDDASDGIARYKDLALQLVFTLLSNYVPYDISSVLCQLSASMYKTDILFRSVNSFGSDTYRLNITTLVFLPLVDTVRAFKRVANWESSELDLIHNAETLNYIKPADKVRAILQKHGTQATDLDLATYLNYMNLNSMTSFGSIYENDLFVVLPVTYKKVFALAQHNGDYYHLSAVGSANSHYAARYVTSAVSRKAVYTQALDVLAIILKAIQPTDGTTVKAWLTVPPLWERADFYVKSLFSNDD
jgi:hypothetical protein